MRIPPGPPSRHPLPAWLRMSTLLVVAVSVLLGAARTGTTYLFCDAMREVREEPCCSRTQSGDPQVTSTDCDCCHRHIAPALPASSAASASTYDVLPPALIAVLGPRELGWRRVPGRPLRGGPRAGIPPPLYERRVVLLI